MEKLISLAKTLSHLKISTAQLVADRETINEYRDDIEAYNEETSLVVCCKYTAAIWEENKPLKPVPVTLFIQLYGVSILFTETKQLWEVGE